MSELLDAKEMWDALTYDQRLAATIVIFEALCEHSKLSGSFRALIDRLGFCDDDWMDLKGAGGQLVNRMCSEYDSRADVLEEDESSTFRPPKTDSDSQPSPIPCPNCGSTHTVYNIPDWEYDPEKGNYCVDPGFLECMECPYNTGSQNTEDEIMAVIRSFSRDSQPSNTTGNMNTQPWTAEAPREEGEYNMLVRVEIDATEPRWVYIGRGPGTLLSGWINSGAKFQGPLKPRE